MNNMGVSITNIIILLAVVLLAFFGKFYFTSMKPGNDFKACSNEASEYVEQFRTEVYAGMGQKNLQAHQVKVYEEEIRVRRECLVRKGYQAEDFSHITGFKWEI